MKKPDTPAASSKPSPAIRGKYTNLLAQGTNLVILDSDLLAHFPDSPSVNQALRAFLAIGDQISALSPSGSTKMTKRSHTKRPVNQSLDPRVGRTAKTATRS
jgi:hypothetical protein